MVDYYTTTIFTSSITHKQTDSKMKQTTNLDAAQLLALELKRLRELNTKSKR